MRKRIDHWFSVLPVVVFSDIFVICYNVLSFNSLKIIFMSVGINMPKFICSVFCKCFLVYSLVLCVVEPINQLFKYVVL